MKFGIHVKKPFLYPITEMEEVDFLGSEEFLKIRRGSRFVPLPPRYSSTSEYVVLDILSNTFTSILVFNAFNCAIPTRYVTDIAHQ